MEAVSVQYDFQTKQFVNASPEYIEAMEDVMEEVECLSIDELKQWMINNEADFELSE